MGGPNLRSKPSGRLSRASEIDRAFLLGSVKSNIGHLDAAVEVVGLIKAILCLETGGPPTVHYLHLTPNCILRTLRS